VPLYVGGRRVAENRRAAFQQAQARHTVELAESLITLELQKAYLEYLESGEQLEKLTEALENAKKTVEGYHDQSVGGFIKDEDMPDFYEDSVAAELLLLQVRGKYNQAVFRNNLTLAKIRLATGANEYLPPPLDSALRQPAAVSGAAVPRAVRDPRR
jgi:outer membrane protein TolC